MRTKDDEGAGLGHERQFAHVDLLLLDVLDPLHAGWGITIVDHQTDQYAQGRGIGDATQLALAHIEHGLAQAVAHVLERCAAVVADNGENRAERCMQALHGPLIGLLVRLQEVTIGIDLRCKQKRNLQHAAALGEVLANAFFLSKRIGHACLPSI